MPARVPPQLDDTPGPPVVIDDREIQTVTFRVTYPGGWRVVTSEARVPPALVLVAPDEVSTIWLITGKPDEAEFSRSEMRVEMHEVTLENGQVVTAVLSAQDEVWDAMRATFERVMKSLRAPTSEPVP